MSVSITVTEVVMDAGLLGPLGLSLSAQNVLVHTIAKELVGNPASGMPNTDGTIRYVRWININFRPWFLMMDVARDGRCLIIAIS